MAEKPSWKNTFNTNLASWGFIDHAEVGASHAGYPYFAWNGRVYDTTTRQEIGTVKDLLDL